MQATCMYFFQAEVKSYKGLGLQMRPFRIRTMPGDSDLDPFLNNDFGSGSDSDSGPISLTPDLSSVPKSGLIRGRRSCSKNGSNFFSLF